MRDRRRKIFPQGSTGHGHCEMKASIILRAYLMIKITSIAR